MRKPKGGIELRMTNLEATFSASSEWLLPFNSLISFDMPPRKSITCVKKWCEKKQREVEDR
jgi:hypothetical protein